MILFIYFNEWIFFSFFKKCSNDRVFIFKKIFLKYVEMTKPGFFQKYFERYQTSILLKYFQRTKNNFFQIPFQMTYRKFLKLISKDLSKIF